MTTSPPPRDPSLEERWRNADLRHRAEAARQKADEALNAGDISTFSSQRQLEARVKAVLLPRLQKGYRYTHIPAGALCPKAVHEWHACPDDEEACLKMRCRKCGLTYGRRIVG